MKKIKNSKVVLLISVMAIQLLRKINRVFKCNLFFGQTGEDIVLRSLFYGVNRPLFYLDIGCNHPISLSNTFGFYLEGGRGICVDANEELIKAYTKIRPRDIALNTLISNNEEEVTFYSFENHVLSTANPEVVEKAGKAHTIRKRTMRSRTLTSILSEHLPENTTMDLLSIDVEGLDFEVLKSLDLNIYRPSVILIEMHQLNISDVHFHQHEIIQYLSNYDYKMKFYSSMNGYFVKV